MTSQSTDRILSHNFLRLPTLLCDTSEVSKTGARENMAVTTTDVIKIEDIDEDPPDLTVAVKGGATSNENDEKLLPEKLQDDEEMPTIFERIMNLFPFLRHVEDRRRVRANDRDYNKQFKYADNVIVTSKYNIITFLPLNLLEQFLRIANFYFLVLVIFQSIPGISSVPVYSTLVPLLGVLAVTAIKDAFDDIKRHVSDYRINTRPAIIVNKDKDNDQVRWKDVRVGDVLKLKNNDFITADLLLLSSSEPNSLVFIETAELDGETNLKVRQPLADTAAMKDSEEELGAFDGMIDCEPPNNRLHKFVGTLDWKGHVYSLDNENILLRGCRLRNTDWMYGLVIYTGHDTKLVKNSGKTKFKRTRIDILMNKMVFFILAFLGFCVTITLIGSAIWEAIYGENFQLYVPFDKTFDSPAKIAFVQILSNIIVFNTFVPISLYVTVEAIRLGLSFLINWDEKMYYAPNDVPAIARTTTLNEELGQIEYIFSDKTGTLTQNIMTFKKCTINGKKYGEAEAGSENRLNLCSWNPYAEESFEYYDGELVDCCKDGQPEVEEFFKLISLCHTVLPSQGEDGKLKYNAQSPDEAALVSAARNFGFVFTARTPFTVSLDVLNREQLNKPSSVNYEVLNILDFNNERKRMSVIVRHPETGKITLYCKGADTIVFERLHPECKELMDTTQKHLGEYAREGLRTLVLAKKEIEQKVYEDWSHQLYEASIVTTNRDAMMDRVYSDIEQNMILLGATAIEDKLQDGVPDTIANLAKADIKIWVLTGDKQETAINIGYSCKLLTGDMKIFVIDAEGKEEVRKQLQDAYDEINRIENMISQGDVPQHSDDPMVGPPGPPFGIVLNGHSLRDALKKDMELLLLETGCKCKAVICCRVTPLQKKKVVDLVKVHKSAVTLAIGDGANDVGMIKAAHIGVGISGLEGQQAVLASDYSFGQFRFLERLLLVHGRWSYHRMALFLNYFFYKNFAFAFSQFLFAFFCGFTAQTLYDPTFIAVYNVIYTSLPVTALGILDQDVTEKSCLDNPRLYIAGQKNKRFNSLIFLLSLLRGICVAFVIFFVLYGLTYLNVYDEGYEWDFQSFGYAASGALILIVNLQIAFDTNYWNPVIHLFIWGSILSWLVVPPFLSNILSLYEAGAATYWGVANEVLASSMFWWYIIIASAMALIPIITIRIARNELWPTLLEDVKLAENNKRYEDIINNLKHQFLHEDKPAPVVPGRWVGSGYAFSHEEGFGTLISTGRYLGASTSEVEEERINRTNTWMKRRHKVPGSKETEKKAPSLVESSLTKGLTTGISVALGAGLVSVVNKDSDHLLEDDSSPEKHDTTTTTSNDPALSPPAGESDTEPTLDGHELNPLDKNAGVNSDINIKLEEEESTAV